MKKLNFCFKGSRNYIHGTDILAKLIEKNHNKQLTKLDIKFNDIMRTNLDLITGEEGRKAKVNIRWIESGEEKFYQLVENNCPVKCNYEYDENLILKKTKIDINLKTINLKQPSGFTFYENLVAMNKHLLQTTFPKENGKWFFTRLEQLKIYDNNSLISLKLIKNFNFKLTKSDVYLNGDVIGCIYFTLVRENI